MKDVLWLLSPCFGLMFRFKGKVEIFTVKIDHLFSLFDFIRTIDPPLIITVGKVENQGGPKQSTPSNKKYFHYHQQKYRIDMETYVQK